MENLDRIRSVFHKRGLKCTPQRLAVLDVLLNTQTHLSINEIHCQVKQELPDMGLATVYRTLEILVDLELAAKVHLENGCHSYTAATGGHRHPILCTDCNRLIEFAGCPIDEISEKLTTETGFLVNDHFLQIFGKCKECQS